MVLYSFAEYTDEFLFRHLPFLQLVLLLLLFGNVSFKLGDGFLYFFYSIFTSLLLIERGFVRVVALSIVVYIFFHCRLKMEAKKVHN